MLLGLGGTKEQNRKERIFAENVIYITTQINKISNQLSCRNKVFQTLHTTGSIFRGSESLCLTDDSWPWRHRRIEQKMFCGKCYLHITTLFNKIANQLSCLNNVFQTLHTTLLIFFLLLQQEFALIKFNPTILQLLLQESAIATIASRITHCCVVYL